VDGGKNRRIEPGPRQKDGVTVMGATGRRENEKGELCTDHKNGRGRKATATPAGKEKKGKVGIRSRAIKACEKRKTRGEEGLALKKKESLELGTGLEPKQPIGGEKAKRDPTKKERESEGTRGSNTKTKENITY